MSRNVDVDKLCQRWVRAKEEDTPTEAVYRPADYPMPPARGRAGLEFRPDGAFKHSAIGANDVSAVSEGKWMIAPGDVGKVRVVGGGGEEELEIRSLTGDRLAIAKAP